jgi:cytoskeletal protein CcmA (bactofilin family)
MQGQPFLVHIGSATPVCYNGGMKKIIVVISVCVLLAPALALAAYFKTGNTVLVGPSEVVGDNAYVAGGNVTVSGTVQGDLLAAGGTLYVSGEVDRDIMVAGGMITIAGVTAEDLRVAGGNVTVGGSFEGEVVAAGGQVTVTPDAQIVKDSHIAGGTIMFNGDEAGDLVLAGGTVVVNGTIGKNLIVTKAQKVTIGSYTVIRGNFEYSAPSEAVIEQGATITGTTTFHKTEGATPGAANRTSAFAGLLTFWFVAKMVMAFVLACVLWYVWKRDMVDVLTQASSHFGRELLRGFAFLILVPVAAVIALITVIGVPLGVIALLLYAVLLMLAAPVAGVVTASLIMRNRTDLRWFHLLLGVLVYAVVMLIPFIGWIAAFVVYFVALGALVNVLRFKFQRHA